MDLGKDSWIAENDCIRGLFATTELPILNGVKEAPADLAIETETDPMAVAKPSPVGDDPTDSVEDVQADVSNWLQATLADPATLAAQLRDAAERLDKIAARNQAAEAVAARQTSLRERLASFRTEASGIAGSTTTAMIDALDRLLTSPATLEPSAIEEGLAGATEYLRSAAAWRIAMDRLAETHDYTGVGVARELEMQRSSEIITLLDGALDRLSDTEIVPAGALPQSEERSHETSVEVSEGRVHEPAAAEVISAEIDDGKGDETEAASISPMNFAGDDAEALTDDEADLVPAEDVETRSDHAERQLALQAAASALAEGRYGLAVHVASVAEYGNHSAPFNFPSTLLRALCAGVLVGTPNGLRAADVFAALQPTVEGLISQDAGHPVRLIAFAASLRPALFSTAAGGDQVLRHLSNLQSLAPSVYGLCTFAAGNVRSGDILPSELARLGDTLAPKAELEALRQDTERFLTSALRRTIKFQPATLIWINLLRGGPVHDALHAIIYEPASAAKLVAKALDGTLADIDRLITEKDREALGGRKREPLTAKPRATLRDWLEDVAARLEEWRRLHDASQKPTRDRYNVQSREELKTRLEAATAELGELDTHGDPALRIASDVARGVVGSVLDLFEGENSVALVSAEDELLLFEPPFDLAGASNWDADERSNFLLAAEAQAWRTPDFALALDEALKRGRLTLVASLREKVSFDDPKKNDALDRKIRGETDRQVTQARSRLSHARARLNDLLGADDRQILSRNLSPGLDELEFQLTQTEAPVDLTLWARSLEALEQQLQRGFLSLLGPLQTEVDTLEGLGQDVADLRKMIELQDLATLSEHIEAYKHGATPPIAATDLLESFNAYLQGQGTSQGQGRRLDLPTLEHVIEARAEIGGSDFGRWEEGEIESARALLQAWRGLKENDNNQSPPQLRALFQILLSTTTVDVQLSKNHEVPGHYQLRTSVFTTREDCIVPAFGSEAKGRYEIVLVDRRNIGSGVELATLKGKLSAPTFFVVRGSMPGAARRAFMQRVRQSGATPACGLIDEATILFLVMRRGWRRSDVFGLSLACGVVQPYSDTAQRTSPEMFFGRRDELRELWDPNGSCLVYGGRQLGKTALLRQIELRHDRTDQLVFYGDDEVEEFTRQGPQGFWRWIALRAEGRGVPMPSKRGADEVQQAIRAWLEPDVTRRMLFLVDEADKFLRSEIQSDFRMLLQLRELMRVTNRRCKFVFAGLHDVQRLARTPNSPLLHFGSPIRVGPLMGKDLFEARNMVEQPMAAAGYAFGGSAEEGRALMGRALSEVGYYPSLMQTFGMVLVNRMNGRASSTITGDPPVLPIRIASTELNAALDDSAFRNNVRDKFDKTLDLDPRYRLIAYLVLIGTQKTASRDDMRPGMSIAEIQKEAMFWWPQGFVEDSSNSAFEGLLKEMEGLGVLVGLNDGRYAIRSARIAAMLGSVTEVEDRIQELADQPFEVIDDTGGLRRTLGKAPSPLTFRQEAVLMETRGSPPVVMALTSQALGLTLLPAAIEELTRTDEELLVLPFDNVDTVPKLERAITAVAARTRDAGRQKGLLIASGAWLGREAVTAAFEHPEVRRSRRLSNQGREQGVRVILCPSMIDWRELNGEFDADRLWNAMLVSLAPLHDASLRVWLGRRANSQAVHPGAIERLREATGGFPDLLGGLKGETTDQIVAAAETARDAMLSEPAINLARMGLGEVWIQQICRFLLDQNDGMIAVGERDSVVELMTDDGLRDVDFAMGVIERLGLFDRAVDREQLSGWCLNPLVARLLAELPAN